MRVGYICLVNISLLAVLSEKPIPQRSHHKRDLISQHGPFTWATYSPHSGVYITTQSALNVSNGMHSTYTLFILSMQQETTLNLKIPLRYRVPDHYRITLHHTASYHYITPHSIISSLPRCITQSKQTSTTIPYHTKPQHTTPPHAIAPSHFHIHLP